MDKVIKIKKGLELVTSCSLGYKTSTEKFLYLLCIMWQSLMMYYEAVFELLQKLHLEIYGSQFMTHKLFHFHLSFWIWKLWKRREKMTKHGISRERKELFRWKKKALKGMFEGLSFGEKKKKNDTKLRMQALTRYLPDGQLFLNEFFNGYHRMSLVFIGCSKNKKWGYLIEIG